MKTHKIADLMVPLAEYATVSQEASMYEAVLALEQAQEHFEDKHTRYRHRAILVLDKGGDVIGKLSQLDVLRALEPKYEDMMHREGLQRFGFTKQFMYSMLKDHHLFDEPLSDICRKAGEQKVTKYMYTPSEGEFVEEDASLDKAIHQLVMGHHQSLLVTRGGQIVGVLRLTDVFAAIFHLMKQCGI